MLVILDRDGVLNVDYPQGVLQFADFQLFPNTLTALSLLKENGFQLALATNQSALSKKSNGQPLLSLEDLNKMHAMLPQIDKFYICADHPDQPTNRRKPAAGMLLEALEYFQAPAACTPFVGDAETDLQAAAAAGCPRYLVRTGKGNKTALSPLIKELQPVVICEDILQASKLIIKKYQNT